LVDHAAHIFARSGASATQLHEFGFDFSEEGFEKGSESRLSQLDLIAVSPRGLNRFCPCNA
jgi:hypothetical protein